MSGFESLPQSLGEGAAYNPIQAEDTAFSGQELTDENALKMVVQDVEFAQKFATSKTLVQEWNGVDDLYRDYVPQDTWPNSKKPRSSLPMPVIMEAVESLVPQAHMAFFSDPQPFLLDPKGNTTPEASAAMAHLLCWALGEGGYEEECRKLLKSGIQYGTMIGKYGWSTITHTARKYSRGQDGKIEIQKKERDLSLPELEYVSLRNVLVDPHTNCQDIRTASYVIHQKYVTGLELDGLRKDGYKNIPSRQQMRLALAAGSEPTKNSTLPMQWLSWRENQAELPTNQGSADPLKQPLEILEYWTDDRVITVLQRAVVIRNEENPMGCKPFLSCCFIDVLNSFYGFGVGKLLAGDQWLQQGLLNKGIDFLSLKANPVWHRRKGAGTMSQNINIAPGKVVNDDGELAPLEMPDGITEEIMLAIQASEARAARRVGANFGPEMPTQAMRTAEGVNAFTSGVQVKLQYFIENFANLVYVPALKAFMQLLKDNLEPDEMKAILSDRDAKAYTDSFDVMQVYNGQYDVDVLSSVKLSARRAMAQMLLPIMQMLGQPAVIQSFQQQAKKFNWVNFFGQVFDVTGWPAEKLVEDMTDQDKQMMAMMNPAVVKAQADQQKTAQTHQNSLELQDAKADGQAGVAVVRSILKAHEPDKKALANQAPGGDKK